MTQPNRTPVWPLAVAILFACIVNWPCVVWGLQFGHDHNLHLTYLHFFGAQLRNGELYPRWLSGINFGAGSPIFFVEYPLPYYVSTFLQWLFHIPSTATGEAHALGLFIFLTGILSSVSSWLWCRTLAGPIVAMLASAAYLTMPYVYSCDVYYRAAIGEYSALAWIPLALFFAHWIGKRPRHAVAGMAFAFAAVVLSNFFTALLFAPFLVLYLIAIVPDSRRLRAMFYAACALGLGLGISAIYFLPMNANRPFFSLANLMKLAPGVFFYRDHLFPFGKTLFPSGHLSLRLIDLLSLALGMGTLVVFVIRLRRKETPQILAWVAIICILLTSAAPVLGLVNLNSHPELATPRVIDVRSRIFLVTFLTLEGSLLAYASLRNYADPLPKFLMIAAVTSYFLTTRWSEWFWQYATPMWNIQFPWRFAGLLSIFALGLIAFALRDLLGQPLRRKTLALACAAVWIAIAVGGSIALDIPESIKPPFVTELKGRVETPYAAYATISHFPTPEELGPNDGMQERVLVQAGEGTARVETVNARHLRVTADCPRNCTLLLKLVYYPLWQAHDEADSPISLTPSNRAGFAELSLKPGLHAINLELPRAQSEIWGAWLSVISLIIAALLCLREKRNLHEASPA
jgi:hypothetical protein